MAGEIGVDPTNLTLRKLAWLYEGKYQLTETVDRLGWRQAFAIVAAVRNTTATKKSDYIDPISFFPYETKASTNRQEQPRVTSGIPLTADNCVAILTSLFGIKTDD